MQQVVCSRAVFGICVGVTQIRIYGKVVRRIRAFPLRRHQETNTKKIPEKKIEIELSFILLSSLDGNQVKGWIE